MGQSRDKNDCIEFVIFAVLCNSGKGFTLESRTERIKRIEYYSKHPLFNRKAYVWKIKSTEDKDLSYFYFESVGGSVNFQVMNRISKEFNNEIRLDVQPVQVLLDERERYTTVPPETTATYIEGRKAFLSVSDECAAKIYREKFSATIPFRDKLLTEHYQILKSIANRYELNKEIDRCQKLESLKILVTSHGVMSNYDQAYAENGMEPLKFQEQIYGMALALIETIKKEKSWFAETRNLYLNLGSKERYGYEGVYIICEPKREFKEW